jgi:hypothetical protein
VLLFAADLGPAARIPSQALLKYEDQAFSHAVTQSLGLLKNSAQPRWAAEAARSRDLIDKLHQQMTSMQHTDRLWADLLTSQ